MIQESNKTTHEKSGGRRVVFSLGEEFWQDAAGWGAIAFVLAVGLAAITYAYLVGGGWTFSGFAQRKGPADRSGDLSAPTAELPVMARRALDGMPLRDGEADDYTAVVIDNIVESRPQSGLRGASLVYEAPVEAGITRLLALYPVDGGRDLEKIGPVRSARPYFVDWAAEMGAVLVHVGGSPQALEQLAGSDLRDLNQFYWGEYFWRDRGRHAPYNVYTSSSLLRRAIERLDDHGLPAGSWRFKPDIPTQWLPEQADDLVVPFREGAYKVSWSYDRGENSYIRHQGGQMHRDEAGLPVRARNIVVQYTEIRVIDAEGRRDIRTAGTGQALIARDGTLTIGSWVRDEASGRTRFLDHEGQDVAFNVGTTWIEVVPKGTEILH